MVHPLYIIDMGDFISINLDDWLSSEISIDRKVSWADSLLKVFSNRAAILVSHHMLRPSYETGDMDFTGEPSYATGAVFNPFGEYLYNALKHNANLFMLITGHRTGSDIRADFYQNREVFSILANYQDMPNPGFSHGTGGWLKIIRFYPNDKLMDIKTYSPVLDSFLVDNSIYFNSSSIIPFNFGPYVNNPINNFNLEWSFADTIKIQLDSIFRYLGGDLIYSLSNNDSSIVKTKIDSNEYLKIFKDTNNSFGSTEIIVNGVNSNNESCSDTFEIEVLPNLKVSDNEEPLIPSNFFLYQNFPNPFNLFTEIRYDLPDDTHVKISIYNIKGKLVKNLIDNFQHSGKKSVYWNSMNFNNEIVAGGLYFCTLEINNFRQSRKIILLK